MRFVRAENDLKRDFVTDGERQIAAYCTHAGYPEFD